MSDSSISAKKMTVETRNSIYVLGLANERGERTIVKNNSQLPFTSCVVTFLEVGRGMRFIPVGSTPGPDSKWHTSKVVSITED